MKVLLKDLRYNKSGEKYNNGFRIVYLYDNNKYKVGEYCETIEGFMTGFAEVNPIISQSEIPKFVSIDDLLDRYLNDMSNINAVAIYDIVGKCIAKKNREKLK